MSRPLLRLLFVSLLVFSAPLLQAQRERLSPEEIEIVEKNWPGTKKTGTGIRYIMQREGNGPSPKAGDRVGVLYIGTLLNGKKFDAKQDPADPLVFRVGREEVIPGWEQILPMMKLNEKRLVIVPGSLAYGSHGRPPLIGRDATLVFEMELVNINP
ncbi:MAG: FKBP-type peptidyl-prolyl cis-trans isomerase [Opitutus sp.]